MVNLTQIEEEFLKLFLDNYENNDENCVRVKISSNLYPKLCYSTDKIKELYYKDLLLREPIICVSGEITVFLASEAFDYFKLKDIEVARYFGISMTEFRVLKYFIEELGSGDISFVDMDLSKNLNIEYNSISRIVHNLENIGYIKLLDEPTLDGYYDIVAYKDIYEDKLLEYKEYKNNNLLNGSIETNIFNPIITYGDNNQINQNNINKEDLIENIFNLLNEANEYLKTKEQDKDIITVVENIEELKEMIETNSIETSEDIDILKTLIVKNQSKFRTVLSDFASGVTLFSFLQQVITLF